MNSSRSLTIAAIVTLLLGSASATGSTVDVYVYSFEFSVNPPGGPVVDAIITVGDTVRWVWVDGNHTTTSVAGSPEAWDANINSNNPQFSRVFTTSGTFHYYCRPHGFDNGDGTAGGMAGTITVLASGSGACCLPTGGCMVTSPAQCQTLGGTYGGSDTSCTPNPCPNQPTTMTRTAAADNTLYEDPLGAVSNGAGQYLYSGNMNNGRRRRALVRFDLSDIPSTALIQSATLRLYCNQASGGTIDVSLSRVAAQWGEGTSDASGNESSGTAATTNDATWLHRYFSATFWTNPGGDFAASPSATVSMPPTANAAYDWSGPGIVRDVQAWVDGAQVNAGWIVRGDEASSANTRRFSSREALIASDRPALVITYLPEAPTGACCLPDGTCVSLKPSECEFQGGTYRGDGVVCGASSCPLQLTPFCDPLPRPAVAQPTSGQPGGSAEYTIAATEFLQQLHCELPPTRCWGYGGSYPGPTIEARRGMPVTVTWVNDLRDPQGNLRGTHVLPVDTCLHGPDVTGETPVLVTHLHGGHVPMSSDGYPEWAFPPGQQSPPYLYPNRQPASTIWYHDHALGITRLNVYMGLAGFYLIRDPLEDALDLPRGEFEIPLAIQDRSFHADGSLRYHEMWHDHFFGDFVLVNGKVWPYLDVKQGKYRFRLLNGSTSRAYTLALSSGATFWQIGSDTGLLDAPIALDRVTLTPGERADVIMDFAPYPAGAEIILTNSAPSPYPGGGMGPDLPFVMQFRVQAQPGFSAAVPDTLTPVERIAESEARVQRDFQLAIGPGMGCPGHTGGMWTINGRMWGDITEFPRLGSTEIWAWWNRSAVTHPMHMHLVSFQVLDRQDFDVVNGVPIGPRMPPAANELGWKDTVQAPPSQITRVIARFESYCGLYPYHCHILEHEDHEMMRQFRVVPVGDVNHDGAVDLSDLTLVLSHFGTPSGAQESDGDMDLDGDVDLADLALLLSHFGTICP